MRVGTGSNMAVGTSSSATMWQNDDKTWLLHVHRVRDDDFGWDEGEMQLSELSQGMVWRKYFSGSSGSDDDEEESDQEIDEEMAQLEQAILADPAAFVTGENA